MDDLLPTMSPGLTPREQVWARRLAQTQAAREELVRLLGLLRILGGIATRSESLEDGALAVCRHLSNYLGLEYCGFHVRWDGVEELKACHGQEPSPAIAALLREKIALGATFAGSLDRNGGQGQLACLPLMGTSERLGGLAMILEQGLTPRQRRHLTMVAEAVAPVLENFILRGRLQELNHSLRQETRRTALSLAELEQSHQEAQACLSGLMMQTPEPLFITDARGCPTGFNDALEGFLGWSREQLLSRRLAEFFAQPADWEWLCRRLDEGLPAVERQLPLLVQCGTSVPAMVCLRRFVRGQGQPGTLGRLSPVEAEATFPQPGASPASQELRDLAELCGEMGNQVNNLLAALRAHLQLALLEEMHPQLRRRLEILELMAEDGKGVSGQVRRMLEQLDQCRQQASAQTRLWLAPGRPAPEEGV